MYSASDDPYCYPGTDVLINKLGLREQEALDQYENAVATARLESGLPDGGLDVDHFKRLHLHLFQDVYDWAGNIRTIRIAKGNSMFCYPENIEAELAKCFDGLKDMNALKGLSLADFAMHSARFLADLNAIHAFRDGNGRTQLSFFAMLAREVGHPVDFNRLDAKVFLEAMIRSFAGEERPLRAQLTMLCAPVQEKRP